jgi:hypothetical protein
MKTVDRLALKKQLIEWRDRQCQAIEEHFGRAFVLLWDEVEQAADKMSVVDVFTGEKFTKREIIPIWERWMKTETGTVMAVAQRELSKISEQTIEATDTGGKLPVPDGSTLMADGAIVATASAGAGVAVVTLLPASVTTIMTGGVFGLFGTTVAVIAWPAALGLVTIVGAAAALGGSRLFNARERAVRHYKDQLRAWMKQSSVDSRNPNSLVNLMQAEIRRVASASVQHLDSLG